MKKLFTFLFALTCATSLFASDIQVDGIWYNFYSSTKTAKVTYRGSSSSSYEDEYSGSVVIPETVTYNSTTYSVTSIGDGAFYNCSGLTSVTIPNSVTTIGKGAFYECSGLTSVTIGNSVTSIGYIAFQKCTGLTSVTIPNSVTTIGEKAFSLCSGLTSVTIGNSVTTIGEYAFGLCEGLTSFNVDAANTYYSSIDGVLFNYAKDTLIQYPIGNSRTEYAIPNSVTTIGEMAFYGCRGLTSVTIPNSVTTIGEMAFALCEGLTSVTIGNSVTTIGGSAFNECSGLKKTNYTGTIAQWCKILFGSSHANPISYSHNFFINNEEVKNLVIPQGVDTIRNYAFYGCSGLTSVTIPNSVTTIGNSAFYNCSGLTSVTIPNSVTTIGMDAFYGCSGLKKTNYTGTIADWCKIKFEFKVKVFGGICSNPMVYSNNFFINDIEVKDLVIPQGVDTISAIAFCECSSLTSITIPNSVTTIGDYAFRGCYRLTSVTIPNSVTTIGNSAFSNCYLTSITCYAVTPPKCGDYAFSNILQDAKVFVPASALTDYQNAEVWKDLQLYPIAAEVTPMDDENPIVTPSDQDVTITWPITDGTDTYTLTITKNGEVVCVLTFNANGQLTNIAFAAPGRDGAHQAPAATLTAQGYQFTVTGLNPGTAYNYSVTATDAGGKTLAEHKGNFSTTGGTGLNTLPYEGKERIGAKYFHNGNLIIERNGIKYTATGQKVR